MAELDTIDVEHKDLKIVKSIFARYLPYKQVWAYGSRVKWTATHTSDLDCVVFGTTDSEIADAKEAFDESNIPFEVQLLNWETIPDDFKENIKEQYFVLQNNDSREDWKKTKLGKIPKKWKYCSVNALVNENIIAKPLDGNHGNIHPKEADFIDNGIPFIMASNINNGNVDLHSCKFISKEQANNLQKGFSVTHDVLLTHKASLGRTAIVPQISTEFIILAPQVTYYRVKDKTQLNNKYLKYYFDSPRFQDILLKHGDAGSTRAYVGITAQKELPVCLPPLPEQRAIASVLSSLDDKIDLLHRQNKTLESIAETLFRRWLIEEAKDDWEEKTLDKVAYYLNGLACQKYPPKNNVDKLPVLKIKDLRTGLSDASDWATSSVPEEYVIQNGDIVFSWSGSLLVKIWDGTICILNQHLFKVTSDQYPKWFVYLWTKHHLRKFTAIAESKATTMGHIKRCDLASSIVTIPTSPELKDISKVMTPIIDKIILNNIQISKLTTIRDMLLPKLMSGDIRVEYEAA